MWKRRRAYENRYFAAGAGHPCQYGRGGIGAVISIDEYPEWVQPTGAHDAYNIGDKVTHNGKTWVSDVDNNVWEPGVYGWKCINGG